MAGVAACSKIICAILSPALMVNFNCSEFTKKTLFSSLKSGSITPAATSMSLWRASPLLGAMRPYKPWGMCMENPSGTCFRLLGGIDMLTEE